MSFKDDVKSDIDTVFENSEEFMELHRIDGREMLASIDEMELLFREKKKNSNVDGVHRKKILLFVAGKTFGPLPAASRVMELDRKKYIVKEAHDEDGMYSIILEVANS